MRMGGGVIEGSSRLGRMMRSTSRSLRRVWVRVCVSGHGMAGCYKELRQRMRPSTESLHRGSLWAQIFTLPIALLSALFATYYARDAVKIAKQALAISIRPAIAGTWNVADTSLKVSNNGNGPAHLTFIGIKFRDKCATTAKMGAWASGYHAVTNAFLRSYMSELKNSDLIPGDTALNTTGASWAPSLSLGKGEEWFLIRGEKALPISDKDKAAAIWISLVDELHFVMEYQDDMREAPHLYSTGNKAKAEIAKCLSPS